MRTYTCILCPNGCELTPTAEGETITVTGARCPKGEAYVQQELTNPQRTISSLVKVANGARPVVGVRLTKPIPKARIPEVMRHIKSITLTAPVQAGQTIAEDIIALDTVQAE